jgi:subtilisin family serine protease
MRLLLALPLCILASSAWAQSCSSRTYTTESGYVGCVGATYSVTAGQLDGTATTADAYSRYQWAMRQLMDGETYDDLFSDAPNDVIVALIDSRGPGPEASGIHNDLVGAYVMDGSNVSGWNFVDGNADTSFTWDTLSPTDGNGHGLCAASIIAGRHNSGPNSGMAGVFARAKILPIRTDLAHLAAAIDYAVSEGASVIHIAGFVTSYTSGVSLDYMYYFPDLYGSFPPRRTLWDTTDRDHYVGIFRDIAASLEAADDAHVIVTTPMGNWAGQITTSFMASRPEVIAVGASNINGEVSPHNSWSWNIDVFAPGGDRRSTSLPVTLPSNILAYDVNANADDPLCAVGNTQYSFGTLTSFAAPHVAGAAAIIKSYLPNADTRTARRLLRAASKTPLSDLNVMQATGGVLSLKLLKAAIDAE